MCRVVNLMAFISQAPSVPPFFVLHRNDVAVTFLLDAGYFDEHPSLGMNPASWTSGDIQVVCVCVCATSVCFIMRRQHCTTPLLLQA